MSSSLHRASPSGAPLSLGIDIGGTFTDLVVLDPNATPLLAFRSQRVHSIEEQLAVLMTLGDDRAVRATYVAGQCAHKKRADGG